MRKGLDTRTRLLAEAVGVVNVAKRNRTKHAGRNEAKARMSAKEKRPQKKAAKASRRKEWSEWRSLREYIRRQASRGIIRLPDVSSG